MSESCAVGSAAEKGQPMVMPQADNLLYRGEQGETEPSRQSRCLPTGPSAPRRLEIYIRRQTAALSTKRHLPPQRLFPVCISSGMTITDGLSRPDGHRGPKRHMTASADVPLSMQGERVNTSLDRGRLSCRPHIQANRCLPGLA